MSGSRTKQQTGSNEKEGGRVFVVRMVVWFANWFVTRAGRGYASAVVRRSWYNIYSLYKPDFLVQYEYFPYHVRWRSRISLSPGTWRFVFSVRNETYETRNFKKKCSKFRFFNFLPFSSIFPKKSRVGELIRSLKWEVLAVHLFFIWLLTFTFSAIHVHRQICLSIDRRTTNW